MKTIRISTDFSETPVGRYRADSDFSGERFRDEYLRPALDEAKANATHPITVDIDGVEGFGSSFLEEAFGGLIRHRHFTIPELERLLVVKCEDEDLDLYKRLIWKYIKEARPR